MAKKAKRLKRRGGRIQVVTNNVQQRVRDDRALRTVADELELDGEETRRGMRLVATLGDREVVCHGRNGREIERAAVTKLRELVGNGSKPEAT